MTRIMHMLGLDPGKYFDSAEYADAAPAQPPSSLREVPKLFAPRLLEDPACYQAPWLETRASVCGGYLEVSKEVKSYLSFRRDWLLSKGCIGNPVAVSVRRQHVARHSRRQRSAY